MNYDRVFAIGIALNVTYAAIEAAAGFWLNSLSLIADAGHNFSDVLGLLLAWAAVWLSRREPSSRHSYGLGRSSILAALANALILLASAARIELRPSPYECREDGSRRDSHTAAHANSNPSTSEKL